eukprot:4866924-Amphidinium_carterae.1
MASRMRACTKNTTRCVAARISLQLLHDLEDLRSALPLSGKSLRAIGHKRWTKQGDYDKSSKTKRIHIEHGHNYKANDASNAVWAKHCQAVLTSSNAHRHCLLTITYSLKSIIQFFFHPQHSICISLVDLRIQGRMLAAAN